MLAVKETAEFVYKADFIPKITVYKELPFMPPQLGLLQYYDIYLDKLGILSLKFGLDKCYLKGVCYSAFVSSF